MKPSHPVHWSDIFVNLGSLGYIAFFALLLWLLR